MKKKKMIAALLCAAVSVGAFTNVVLAEAPELQGPGNVTLKRLGYNVAFDPNKDIIADVIKEATGYDLSLIHI